MVLVVISTPVLPSLPRRIGGEKLLLKSIGNVFMFNEREGRQLEFKQELSSYAKVVKTVVAFSNDIGGRIIIGIEDGSRDVVGLNPELLEQHLERLPQAIYDSVTPACRPLVRVLEVAGKQLIEIVVTEGHAKPYYVSSMGVKKGAFLRVGAHTKLAENGLLKELVRSGLGRSFDEEPIVEQEKDVLDDKTLISFYGGVPSIEQLLSDKVLVLDRITSEPKISLAGLVYFGKDTIRFLPQAEILLTIHPSVKVSGNFITHDISGTLEFSLDFIMSHLEKALVARQEVKGLRLETTEWEVPRSALREVLLNALIHRRYDISDAVKVSIFSDRVEVLSPGNFPGPISDFLSGISYSRNPHLRQLARKRGLVEKRGLGLRLIIESCKENHNPEPKIEEIGLSVLVTLYRTKVANEENLIPDYLLPLWKMRKTLPDFQTGEAATILSVNRNTARVWLEELHKNGIVEKRGNGRGAKWVWR